MEWMARDVNALAIVPRFSSLSFLLPFIPLSFTWERMSVTLIPTTFVAIKLGHPIFPTVFDLQPTPSGPLRRRNALFHRANLRTTHNASLCSVYRVFQVFARKSLARSFGYVFYPCCKGVCSVFKPRSFVFDRKTVDGEKFLHSVYVAFCHDCVFQEIFLKIFHCYFCNFNSCIIINYKFLNISFFAISISDLRRYK